MNHTREEIEAIYFKWKIKVIMPGRKIDQFREKKTNKETVDTHIYLDNERFQI